MKRREVLGALGGAALTWPLGAHAQKPIPVVGFLHARSAEDVAYLTAAFRTGLAETGFIENKNVSIQYRFANGQYGQLPELAADLVRGDVTVIAAGSDPAATAAKAATRSIPIIFAVGSDPVKLGLVASVSRPGGNATGINILTSTLEAKRLGLLRDLVPQAKLIGVLMNPNYGPADNQVRDIQQAAQAIGLPIQVFRSSTDSEIASAFEAIEQHRVAAFIVAADPFLDNRRDKIVAFAAHLGVPAMYQFREHAAAGGLMSYGIDLADVYRQVGVYVGRLLNGAKTADLPVTQPIKFEFVINLKTAKALGVKFSADLLSLADEVIE